MHTRSLAHTSLALVSLLAPACAFEPYDGQHLPGRSSPFAVQGFGTAPSLTISVQAYNVCTGVWDQVATASTSTSPTLPAEFWPGSPDLFYFSLPSVSLAAVAPAGCASSRKYWDASGYHARLQLRQPNGQRLFFGEQSSVQCFYANVAAKEFYPAAYDCGFDDNELDLYNDEIH